MKKTTVILLVLIAIGLVIPSAFIIANSIIKQETIKTFEFIEEKPSDFVAVMRDIEKGQYVDLCELDEAYWKQPEFYSSWKLAKEKWYDNKDYSRWGVYGQGNAPSEIAYRVNMKEGDSFEVCTFFHNGFGIWTYQGFELVPLENEYFDVILSPNILTVDPTFPVFGNNWVQKIKVKVRAKQDVPKGDYTLGFDAYAPPFEYSKEETKRVLAMTIDKEQYNKDCSRFINLGRCEELTNLREKKYIEGGGYQSSERLFTLKLEAQ